MYVGVHCYDQKFMLLRAEDHSDCFCCREGDRRACNCQQRCAFSGGVLGNILLLQSLLELDLLFCVASTPDCL